jgi:hypothetical protein
MLGRPTRQDIEEQERRVRGTRAWWQGVLAEQPQFAPEAIAEIARTFGQRLPKPIGEAATDAEQIAAADRPRE